MNKDMSNDEYLEFLNIINTLPKKEYEIIRRGVLQLNDDKKELFNEIDRLNNIINEAIEYNKSLCELYDLGSIERSNADTNLIILGDKEHLEILKELKKEGK